MYTYEGNDNILYGSGLQLTVNGLSFVTGAGTDYNLFRYAPIYQAQSMTSDTSVFYDNGGDFTATIEAVPEPSQYAFFIVLAAAAFVIRRKLSHSGALI